ncbi:transcription factor IIA subunit alpha [Chytridiales sp. JEL 0842]|nr:transcription factor IIA subunit alpha [Chytridiales sp. JEL 0842]
MTNQLVPGVYQWIITDVITKMTDQFANLGIHEQVLRDLQRNWEAKLRSTGVANFPNPNGGGLAGGVDVGGYQMQQLHQQQQQHGGGYVGGYGAGGVGAGFAEEFGGFGGGRYLGQNDGVDQHGGDGEKRVEEGEAEALKNMSRETIDEMLISALEKGLKSSSRNEESQVEGSLRGRVRRRRNLQQQQLDGNDDDDDDDDDNDDDPDNLNSDLDSSDSDDEDPDMENMILCQYEKVSRIKNKWKCVFKDGVISVDGKDYLFSKANAEFEW